jgi:hypothetical protein
MEKTIGKQGLPDTDSIEELASFWDNHDLTDFEKNLEETKEPVFMPAKGTSLRIDLPPSDAQRLKTFARSRGLDETALLRQWIVEKLNEVSEAGRQGSKEPLRQSVRKARGG